MIVAEWKLAISRKQYIAIYAGLPAVLDQMELFESKWETDTEFTMKFLSSKMWRMNAIYTVIDKEGDKVVFRMNLAQHLKYAAQLRHPRVIVLKSRQRGISTGTLIDYNDDALFIDNTLVGMQSYGLEESAALLEKLQVLWFSMNTDIVQFLGQAIVKNNTKSVAYANGSEVKVQTSFRGSTLQRLHVSELGKIANKDPKKAKELKSGTLQAIKMGMPVTIESTAEGEHNAFAEWWNTAVELIGERSLKDFYPLFLTWCTDPDCAMDVAIVITAEQHAVLDKISAEYAEYIGCPFELTDRQKWWAVAQMRELGDDFMQEYPHTPAAAFASVHDGAYYAKVWREHGKVSVEELYDPLLPVYTSWDLGVNDRQVVLFWQKHGVELRVVDCYVNTGEGLMHYLDVLKLKVRERGFRFSEHIFPHDIKVKEWTSGKTRYGVLRGLGMKDIRVLPRTAAVVNDIEICRGAITREEVVLCGVHCAYVVKMMGRYTKRWNEVLGVFDSKPLHDEWSNPADSFRYGIMGERAGTGAVRSKPRKKRRRRGMAL